jgi:hypothetical protein
MKVFASSPYGFPAKHFLIATLKIDLATGNFTFFFEVLIAFKSFSIISFLAVW